MRNDDAPRLLALILAGGSGTRFWPLSRRDRPKQMLPLVTGGSLLRDTVDRLDPLVPPRDVWVCTTEGLAEEVRRQLPRVPPEQVLAEPVGRNTAPAIAWAIRSMPAPLRALPIAVLPSDHRVTDPEALRIALATAARAAAEDDSVVTLGVRPTRPETGYGYLELADEEPVAGVRRLARFVEKPDRPTAERFLASGSHLWNAGIFVFRGTTLLEGVADHLPDLARGLDRIDRSPELTGEIYQKLPSISIDHGVMEKLSGLGTVPLDAGWSDLGSWEALAEVHDGDEAGNVVRGDVVARECRDAVLWSESGTIAAIGVEGLVVVRTADAVLVVPKDRSQEVRELVAALRDRVGGDDLL